MPAITAGRRERTMLKRYENKRFAEVGDRVIFDHDCGLQGDYLLEAVVTGFGEGFDWISGRFDCPVTNVVVTDCYNDAGAFEHEEFGLFNDEFINLEEMLGVWL